MRLAAVGLILALGSSAPAHADAGHETVAEWVAYVARTADRPVRAAAEIQGELIEIPGGTIYRSTGSIVIRNTTVDHVTSALWHPGTPPSQEDVLESRVLERNGNTLRVYLRLARTAVVTVVYDTEHLVTFTRHSPTMATSRSVSTRIAETGGRDRGFLWRLNSYWRYTQVGDDVRVDLESLSLSRSVPRIAGPVARPIIDRIARESMARTLESVRQFLEKQV